MVITVSCNNPETEKKLALAAEVMDANPDSAKKILETITHKTLISKEQNAKYALLYTQALDKCELLTGSDSLISIATKYFKDNDPENAGYAWFYKSICANISGISTERANALIKAEEFASGTNNNYLKALVYNEKANMYREQSQNDSSILYFKYAEKVFERLTDKRNIVITYLNIGNQFLSMKNSDSALYYFTAAESNKKLLNDNILLSTINRCFAVCYLDKKNYSKALSYLNEIKQTNIPIYDSNTWYIMAKVYLKANQLNKAKYYLSKVAVLGIMAPDYYSLWAEIYKRENNLNKALIFASKVNNAIDSIYKQNLKESFAGLEKKYNYQSLLIKNQELTININKNRIIILVVLLVSSVILIVFQAYRVKVRKIQLKNQAEIIQKDKKLLEREKENNYLLEKQFKVQEVLIQHVEEYKINSKKGKSFHNDASLNLYKDKTFYADLMTFLDFEFPNFLIKLKESYPQLTELDILICCLLLTGFESGMIATILNVKIDSINKQRYRLRTRLQLQKSENLIDFLRKL